MYYKPTPTNIMCVFILKLIFVYPIKLVWLIIRKVYYALKTDCYYDDEYEE